MATTIIGAIREHLIGIDLPGVNDDIFLDFAPAGTIPPYITCNDFVSQVPGLKGDGRTSHYDRQLQINVWQHDDNEDAHLPVETLDALDGVYVSVAGNPGTYAVSVNSLTRLPGEINDDIVHHEMTLAVTHPRNIA